MTGKANRESRETDTKGDVEPVMTLKFMIERGKESSIIGAVAPTITS